MHPGRYSMSWLLVAFEDDLVSNFYPLTLTRPVFDLTCGTMTLLEKLRLAADLAASERGAALWHRRGDGRVDIWPHTRGYLAAGPPGALTGYGEVGSRSEGVTLVNGRLLARKATLAAIDPAWPGRYVSGSDLVAVNVPKDRLAELDGWLGQPLSHSMFSGLPAKEVNARLVAYPWDIVRSNGKEISHDFEALGGHAMQSGLSSWIAVVEPDRLRLGRGVKASPGVVLDASGGPIIVDDGTVLMANASITGPAYVGRDSIVRMGARIYGETTIGPVSKIGGEVVETVFHGHSNKQHEGFVGHSYIGEWVNLGAGTDTSDMKNNYSTVKVFIDGRETDSGETFVGLFMGDHSKSGIGTVFNTGTVVGVCCNIFGGDYPPKYIPSFAWGGSGGFVEYDLGKALETARRAMARRGEHLDAYSEAVLRKVFDIASGERKAFLG
jgi:UDP-N-acetylglucosamine diphosphorylase/glucosamine-1-phosphate N-acetyltransferase